MPEPQRPPKIVRREDLPKIYQKAGNESARAQKSFLQWNIINLALLTLGALLSAFKDALPGYGKVAIPVLLAIGAGLTFWLRKSRVERRWYTSRAVAESVKTLAWRYMMRADPFGTKDGESDAEFNKRVGKVAKHYPGLEYEPDEITAKMRQVRLKAGGERASIYHWDRAEDQRRWYSVNAGKNDRRGKLFLWIAGLTQAGACGFAVCAIFQELPDWVGVFATLSASFLAWMQIKQFEDIAQAYHTAASELEQICAVPVEGFSEEQLSAFVADSETAISREHTLWVARRLDSSQ